MTATVGPSVPAHRRLHAALRGLGAPSSAGAAAAASVVGAAPASLLPLPLDVHGRGIAPHKLEQLRALKQKAVAAEDYRAAAEMHDLLTVLDPSSTKLTVADAAAPADVDAQLAFFHQHGFLVLPGVFAGEQLAKLQAAWRRVQRPALPRWRAQLEVQEAEQRQPLTEFYRRRPARAISRNFFDVPTPELYAGLRADLEAGMKSPDDAVLLDLLDPPRLTDILKAILGQDLHMFAIQARTYPPSSSISAGGTGFGASPDELRGYIGWHRDFAGPGQGVSVNPAAVIKVFTFFEDVSPEGGCTTVVPGSHHLTFDPRDAFRMEDLDHGSDEQAEQRAAEHVDPYYHVQPQSAMPNAFRFAVNAGDVCLFGAHPNRPGKLARRRASAPRLTPRHVRRHVHLAHRISERLGGRAREHHHPLRGQLAAGDAGRAGGSAGAVRRGGPAGRGAAGAAGVPVKRLGGLAEAPTLGLQIRLRRMASVCNRTQQQAHGPICFPNPSLPSGAHGGPPGGHLEPPLRVRACAFAPPPHAARGPRPVDQLLWTHDLL